jgi:hypothetical protein
MWLSSRESRTRREVSADENSPRRIAFGAGFQIDIQIFDGKQETFAVPGCSPRSIDPAGLLPQEPQVLRGIRQIRVSGGAAEFGWRSLQAANAAAADWSRLSGVVKRFEVPLASSHCLNS